MSRLRMRAAVMAMLVAAVGGPTRAATPAQVDAAIERAVNFLCADPGFKASGHWELSDKRGEGRDGDSLAGPQWGGKTALLTYALLSTGMSPNDPKLRKPIAFLRRADMIGYYALGLRPQVWLYLPRTPENQEAVVRDFKLLWAGVEKDTSKKDSGLYDYTLNDRTRIDLSVSQYGVLGMWACAQLNMEVPAGDPKRSQPNFWNMVESRWRALQDKRSGGWSYDGTGSDITPSMTAAGVATLFVTQEYLHSRDGITCAGNTRYPEIERGIQYLAAALPQLLTEGAPDQKYTLYGIERIGVASGLKYLGNIDWYQAGADYLVRTQAKDGSWTGDRGGPDVTTAFAVLFLSRGRESVMVNKVKYDLTAATGQKVEGFWNQRGRDIANVARFVSRQTERPLNWQIVDLSVCTVDDLHDAPIAYLSGAQTLNLAPEQVEKLRQYVEEGGMLVFHEDCDRRSFSASAQKLVTSLFGKDNRHQLRQLEAGSVILGNQQFKSSRWRTKPDVKAIGNGVREFALIIEDDIAKSWQVNEATVRPEHFEFMADVFQYSIDKIHAEQKGHTHVVRPDMAIATTSTIKVARLDYASGPNASADVDPEPGGWRRLAAILRNRHKVALDVATVQLGVDDLDGYHVAHLTGVDRVTFTDAQAASLKRFVEAGGLLVVDAAGGSIDFANSMTKELEKISTSAGGEGGTLLEPTDGLFTAGGLPVPKFEYRLFRKATGDAANRPSLRSVDVGGRHGIIFSADDLSVGLVGNQIDGIRGYTPETATEMMIRIVLYGRDAKTGLATPKPPAPRAATAPATRPATRPATSRLP